MGVRLAAAAIAVVMLSTIARAEDALTVQPIRIQDEKAVFATVETHDVLPARVRSGGTVASLTVKEGDEVERGQVMATVGDPKLVLQKSALDAQIAGLEAQSTQAKADFDRAQRLLASGTVSKAQYDTFATASNVASNSLKARSAERAVVEQQLAEGQVLAPASGRVLKVSVTPGTVVMSGEQIAVVAQHDLVLRLRIPERHASSLKVGDPVRLGGDEMSDAPRETNGTITLVYPQIQDGRVVADARATQLGDFFVGERVRVWIPAGTREAFIVPESYLASRFGLDYARLKRPDGQTLEILVQRGRTTAGADGTPAVEILSGLKAGDQLVRP